jgi:hypothetical protein
VEDDTILDAASHPLDVAYTRGKTNTASKKPIFTDVPFSYRANRWIERLYNAGITGGCGGDNYCPVDLVTRAQMAIFLLRAEHGSSCTPPAATGVFGDVSTSYWGANWIEQLYAEGITGGCGSGNYCPETAVKQQAMAAFIDRAFDLPLP